MRKMFSKKQIEDMVEQNPQLVINALVGQDLSLANLSIAQNLAVHNEAKVFEAMTDENNHKRFIEGEINLIDSVPEGITKTYGKWSLSGSHLLIVLALTMAEGTEISGTLDLALINVPQWIKDKLYFLFGYYIDVKTFTVRASDGTSQNLTGYLIKSGNNLYISTASLTLTKTRNVRISFDLLVDNESE